MTTKPTARHGALSNPYRSKWGQVFNPRFHRSALLIPRQGRDDVNHETFAPAAQIRQAATISKHLVLRTPQKNAANELRRVGFDDLRELHSFPTPVSQKGIFTALDHLGMAAAFSRDEQGLDDARAALDDEYEFVEDFELSIPCRVILTDVPSNRSRSATERREWPLASGVELAHTKGVKGAGTLIGVLDTGVDADHPEFAGSRIDFRYVSLQPNSPYWPPRDVRGFDTDGHGTHVCGIIAGRNLGVAPDARLYTAAVIESETIFTSLTRVAAGLNWIFRQFTRPDNEHLPAVLSLSLGFPAALPGVPKAEYQGRLRVMQTLLQTLKQANVLPVVAIGNDGPGTFGYPGAFDDVIGVGAVDFEGAVADFSGSGRPTPKVSKPDLVGYGVGVNSSLERDYGGSAVYQRMNGTSMATPYVAAIASLYRSVFPARTVDDIRAMLIDSALPLDGSKQRTGAGLARFVQPRWGTQSAGKTAGKTKAKRKRRRPTRGSATRRR